MACFKGWLAWRHWRACLLLGRLVASVLAALIILVAFLAALIRTALFTFAALLFMLFILAALVLAALVVLAAVIRAMSFIIVMVVCGLLLQCVGQLQKCCEVVGWRWAPYPGGAVATVRALWSCGWRC